MQVRGKQAGCIGGGQVSQDVLGVVKASWECIIDFFCSSVGSETERMAMDSDYPCESRSFNYNPKTQLATYSDFFGGRGGGAWKGNIVELYHSLLHSHVTALFCSKSLHAHTS